MGKGWQTSLDAHLFVKTISLPTGSPPGPCIDPDTNITYFCPAVGYSESQQPYEIEVTLWHPDGSQGLYQYLDNGSGTPPAGTPLRPEPGTTGRLVFSNLPNSNKIGYQYLRNDGYAELYDDKGRLLTVTNPNKQTHTYAYDSTGRLAKVTDDFGRQLVLAYDPHNHITTLTDPAGEVYAYSYDSKGNLTSVTFPDGAVVQYVYEDVSHPHALTGIVDANGKRYETWSYDDKGRAVASHLAGNADVVDISYNDDGSTDVTEPTGHVRHLTFTSVNYVNLMTAASAPCPSCNDASQSITYDGNGFISSTTDFNSNVTDYTHDASGLELSRTEAVGTEDARTITTQWNTALRKPTLINETGKTTAFTYDDAGRLLSKSVTDTRNGTRRTTTYTYNGSGLLQSVTGPLGYVTHFNYDTTGDLATITNALGQVTQITRYDANGDPLTIIGPNGVKTDLAYDARQRLVSRTVGGNTTRFDYDAAGELIQVTLPTGAYLHYSYDAAHRLTGIRDNLGNRIEYKLDALGNHVREDTLDPNGKLTRSLQHVYDSLNHLTETIGGAGQTTQYVDDPLGNPTSITDPLQHVTVQSFDALNRLSAIVDPLNGRTTFAYDSQNRPTEVTDPRGLTTHYVYDAFGDLIKKDSPDTGTTTYTYDAAGNRLSQTDARGITATYTYDALNRLTSISYRDSSENVTYTYDQGAYGIGHLTGIQDESGTTSFQYDARGNVIQKAVTVDGHSFTVGYQYDAANELVGITYPDGMHVSYQRNAAGRITGVTATRNGVTQTVASAIAYEPFGPVTSLTYGNGLTETRHYDQAYRLTSLSVPGILDWSLANDADDDIISITDNLNPGNSQAFGYDPLNRLTAADGTYGALTYGYDADGNRTTSSLDGTPTAYGYASASNRLLSVGGKSYQYDAVGNLIRDGVHTYRYNDTGRLTGYDAHPDAYLYNGLGQRVRKPFPVTPGDANDDGVINQNDLHSLQDALKGRAPVSAGMDCNEDGDVNNKDKSCVARQIGKGKDHNDGSRTNGGKTYAAAAAITNSSYVYFVYDGAGHLLGGYDDSGNLIREHIWLGNRPLAVSTPDGLDYVTADQVGTPRAIIDHNQQLVWQWQSDPFGNRKPIQDPSSLGLFVYNLRFPGQYFDAETSSNYNYFRNYQPATGRYDKSDPIGLAGGLNSYAYVNGNPLHYADQIGLSGLSTLYMPDDAPLVVLARDLAAMGAYFEGRATDNQALVDTAAGVLNENKEANIGALLVLTTLRLQGEGAELCSLRREAYHYTSDRAISLIKNEGLRAGSYATPNGKLSPLQAQIDLALPPNRGLPGSLLRIDVSGLRQAGYEIPDITKVQRDYGMPGGGYEMQFPYRIPPQFISVIRP